MKRETENCASPLHFCTVVNNKGSRTTAVAVVFSLICVHFKTLNNK